VTDLAAERARAQVMLDLKRHDEAAALLRGIVAADPDDGRAWCLLAGALLGARQLPDAAEAAGRAAELRPSDDWPYRLMCMTRIHQGHGYLAETAAREAVRLAPSGWRSHVCLAEAKLAVKTDFDGAERAAAEARRLAPNEPEVYVLSGRISLARGERRAARDYQEQALALNPSHSEAMNQLGRIALRRPGSPQAARHFIQAARSAPKVGIYGQNVAVAVRHAVSRVVYLASLASWVVVLLNWTGRAGRTPVVAGLAAIAVLSGGLGAVQLARMPAEVRQLLRSRTVGLALGVAYAPILLAVVVAILTPRTAMQAALFGAAILIIAGRFASVAILRRVR
jgi:tetratricopeptide (TPR) repeat protein